ncbi:hypothetical protein ACFSCZ_14835 [Siminovitchia sediminis]|uniref:Uncharacterized protein n=1 Tax=Siminovitchia sediminis TaxID=1274353 RepID=A0ABW4KP34_9BACI
MEKAENNQSLKIQWLLKKMIIIGYSEKNIQAADMIEAIKLDLLSMMSKAGEF